MRRASSASGSARSVALLSLFCGALTLPACVRSSGDDMFKNERCTLGEEACGCRADKTCSGALACLSDLCVDASGRAGTTSSGGIGGGAAGSAGAAHQSGGGGEDTSAPGGSGGSDSGGEGSSAGESNHENGGGSGQVDNLIENGDFSDAEAHWTIEPAQVDRSIADGALCLTIQGGESASLGWPSETSRAFELQGGQSYTFSYRASSSGPLAVSVTAKIGHAVAPYTAHFEEPITIGNTLESDSHEIEVEDSDDGAGVLFSITGAQGKGATSVCFDDVSVLERP
jgi:hypothetical protein